MEDESGVPSTPESTDSVGEAMPGHCVRHALRSPAGVVPRLSPTAPIADALSELVDGEALGILVEEAGHVYGVLTYQSICEILSEVIQSGQSLDRWARETLVQECTIPPLTMLQEGDSLLTALSLLETTEVLPVAGPNLLSYADVLAYFGEKTKSIFEIERVEIGLRDLISMRVPEELIEAAISNAHAEVGAADHSTGSALNSLSMNGVIGVFLNRENYDQYFSGMFASRTAASSVLLGLNELRNDIFHFRGVIDQAQAKRLTRAATLIDTFVRGEKFKRLNQIG